MQREGGEVSVRSFHRSVEFPGRPSFRIVTQKELLISPRGRVESQDIMAALTNLFLRADGKVGRRIHVGPEHAPGLATDVPEIPYDV